MSILEPEFCKLQAPFTNRSSVAIPDNEGMETIGDRIKLLRKNLGLSQREVADAVKVITQEGLSQLERFPDRMPTLETIQALSKFFQVDQEWLLTGKGPQSPIHSLTPDESELILLFRALSAPSRGYVLGRTRDVYRDEYDRKRLAEDSDTTSHDKRPGKDSKHPH